VHEVIFFFNIILNNLFMKKVLLSAFVLLSCCIVTGQDKEAFRLSEEASFEFIKSPEYQTVAGLKNEFIDKIEDAIERGTSLETIRRAALDNNDALFYSVVFGSIKSGQDFIKRSVQAKADLYAKNPFIEQNKELFLCTTCKKTLSEEIDFFFKNFPEFSKNQPLLSYKVTTYTPGPTCGSYWNQLKLGLCATGCGVLTGGTAIALCGWACWCTFCATNSTLAASICK
jgi:hypothetical protein